MGNTTMKKTVSGRGAAKVPVVMQMEALECGAASLTMILAYYGKWLPLEKVRVDCGVSRDGSKARNILRAARSYGLTAQGYRMTPEKLREKGTFPCIIHWNFNHFVVLCGFRGGRAVLNDPAAGTRTVPAEEFDASFTGVCLLFEPGEAFEPGGKPASVLDFAKERMRGTGAAVLFVVLTTVISSLAGILRAGFSRVFLDQLLTGANPEWLLPFTLGLSLLTAAELAMAWLNAVYSLRINGKMSVTGSAEYLWRVLHLPMGFFSQRLAGDIQQRMDTNATISAQLVNTLAPLAIQAGMMVFYLAVMLRYSVALTLVGFASIGVNLLMSQYISQKRVNLTRSMARDSGKLQGTTVAGIEMIETLKSSGAENGFFEKWAGYQASVGTQSIRFEHMEHSVGLVPAIVAQLADSAVLVLGVLLVLRGEFTVGSVYIFQGLLASFCAPAYTFIGAGQTIIEMRTDMERIRDVMEYPAEQVFADGGEEGASYQKLSGEVELRHVTFGYAPLSPPLISDFNMHIRPGSRVAFVGASGCGKSTLSNLISGLYRQWSGEILFDGKPISELDRSVFCGSVAVVDQEIILFEDTIANNIKMWNSSIEDFEMIMAARDAQLHEDILLRDGGYQYRLTEGGKDLSGGQRQRMEIARVLAQDPTLIILDEATSALDAKTEYEVVKAIRDRGITCIVIAHRLSTIRDCDEIVVLDHGTVVERGTHDELMALNGRYAELVTSE